MVYDEIQIVFPEGDRQEIDGRLQINQVVDINGRPLPLPLPSHKIIAFRVYKKTTEFSRNATTTLYHLELIQGEELFQLSGG